MWGFFTMKLCLPMYYKEILNFDITTVSHHDVWLTPDNDMQITSVRHADGTVLLMR